MVGYIASTLPDFTAVPETNRTLRYRPPYYSRHQEILQSSAKASWSVRKANTCIQ